MLRYFHVKRAGGILSTSITMKKFLHGKGSHKRPTEVHMREIHGFMASIRSTVRKVLLLISTVNEKAPYRCLPVQQVNTTAHSSLLKAGLIELSYDLNHNINNGRTKITT